MTETFVKHKKVYRKIKRGSGKNVYFTQEHQEAIEKYIESTDKALRNKLYVETIAPVMKEMIDNIVYTFRFNTLPNIDHHKDECMHQLVTIINKFDKTRGTKAFSYFSLVIKNHFIQAVKKNSKKAREEVFIDASAEEKRIVETEFLQEYVQESPTYLTLKEKKEKEDFFCEEVASWEEQLTTDEERKVHEAFFQIYENIDKIDIINKRAILLYIEEITGLPRKTINLVINTKMLELYKNSKHKWLNKKEDYEEDT